MRKIIASLRVARKMDKRRRRHVIARRGPSVTSARGLKTISPPLPAFPDRRRRPTGFHFGCMRVRPRSIVVVVVATAAAFRP